MSRLLPKTNPKHVKLILTAIALIISATVLLGVLIKLNAKDNGQTNPDTTDTHTSTIDQTASSNNRPHADSLLTIEGTVTMLQRSCYAESIYPEEREKMKMLSSCDGPSLIRVNRTSIYTSTGGPAPDFSVGIDSAALDDTVIVKYIKDPRYGWSLNCNQCSVTVTKKAK